MTITYIQILLLIKRTKRHYPDKGICFSKYFFIIQPHTYENVFLSDKSKFL